MNEIKELCNPKNNMKNLRKLQLSVNAPILPCIDILLNDLEIFEMDNNTINNDGSIDFDKLTKLSQIISKNIMISRMRYEFRHEMVIQELFDYHFKMVSQITDYDLYKLRKAISEQEKFINKKVDKNIKKLVSE